MDSLIHDVQNQHLRANDPAEGTRQQASTIAVLGAGMMGKGIAFVAAAHGLEVWVKDASLELAHGALASADALLAKQIGKGEITPAARARTLERLHVTDRNEDLACADIVIEAVPERPALKSKLIRATEPLLGERAIWASNTSTLPITGLAQSASRPERVIGMHFFSPVHRMQLVEVVKGLRTSAATLARALDFVVQIGKRPIVVNDSRGFFTSRVFSTFTREGVAMVGEGQDPAAIESAAVEAGFPIGPLAVLDEISLALSYNNRLETLKASAAEGRSLSSHPADTVMQRMVENFGRKGRAAGGGFYDYTPDGGKVFWTGLAEHFARERQIPARDMQDRMLFCMALESVRILQERVLASVEDGNVGSVLGIGFPRRTGGVFEFLNNYGLADAVRRADELEARYGARFAPPQLLRNKAARSEAF